MLMVIVIAGVAICLIVGLALGKMTLVWCALAASLVGVLAMGLLILRRRKASSPTAAPKTEASDAAVAAAPDTVAPSAPDTAAPATEADASADAKDAPAADAPPAEPVSGGAAVSDTAEPSATGSATAGKPAAAHVPAAAGSNDTGTTDAALTLDQASTVLVVPGRQRFHLPGCRLLAEKSSEEISLDEATEEGFSACTVCIPQRDRLSRA